MTKETKEPEGTSKEAKPFTDKRRVLRNKVTGMLGYESDGLVGNRDWEPVDGKPPTPDPNTRSDDAEAARAAAEDAEDARYAAEDAADDAEEARKAKKGK